MINKISIFLRNPYIFLSLLIIFFFFPIFFQNQVFYFGDTLTTTLPYKEFFIKSISSGVFPLWNPYINIGYPLFADISVGNYYPGYLILFISNTMRTISFLVILHFLIAAFFSYKLGRLLNLTKAAATFGSIVFTFSGVLVDYTADLSRLFVVCLYPLFFFCLLTLFNKKNIKWIIICSFVLCLQIFAGHIQYVFIQLLVSPLFIFFKEKQSFLIRKTFFLFLIIILGVLFSSVILIPSLDVIPLTTRSEIYKDISIYQNFSLNPLSLTRFFLANFWGIRNQGYAWGTKDTSSIGYLGFIPLMLILFNLGKIIKNKNMLLFLLGSFIALVISFGNYLPFFKLFINILPLFKIFRNPMAFLSIYSFFMAILAGFSFDKLITKENRQKIYKRFILGILLITTIFYLLLPLYKNIPNEIIILIADVIKKNLSTFHTVEVDYLIARFISFNILIIGILALLYLFFIKHKKLLILIIFLDLLIFTRGNFFTIETDYLKQVNPLVSFLKQNLNQERYLSISEIIPYKGMFNYYGSVGFQPPFSKEGKRQSSQDLKKSFLHEFNLIPPNFSMYWGIPTIDGTTTFIMKDYYNYFQFSSSLNFLYQEESQYNPFLKEVKADKKLSIIDLSKVDFNSEVFDNLAVRYIITDWDLHLSHHQLVFENKGIRIYENKNVKPRVLLLDVNNKIIEKPVIIKENPNEISIKTQQKGNLVIRDLYYPGWKAYLGKDEVEVKPFEKIFRLVAVSKEKSVVTLKFQPQSFYLGVSLSAVSLSLTLGYLLLSFLRRTCLKN